MLGKLYQNIAPHQEANFNQRLGLAVALAPDPKIRAYAHTNPATTRYIVVVGRSVGVRLVYRACDVALIVNLLLRKLPAA